MAETDLLPIDPDYPVDEDIIPGTITQPAESGQPIQRIVRPDRRVWELLFAGRSTDEKEQLQAFYHRLKGEHFVFPHKTYVNNAGTYQERRFPVVFDGAFPKPLVANDTWAMRCRLIEAPGKVLQTADYPDPANGIPTFFIEEDHAVLAAALIGTWTAAAHANAHAGNERTNPNTNTTDAFQFTYAGYGFRIWARRDTNLGIFRVYLDEVDLGTVDLYNASAQVAAAIFTRLNVTLGKHRVKIEATNTRNAGSSANTIIADAIEVIP